MTSYNRDDAETAVPTPRDYSAWTTPITPSGWSRDELYCRWS